jgi:hypothetical protein
MEEPQFELFACVVDGEYAGTLGVSYSMPALIAGMHSSPTIVPISAEQNEKLRLGCTYDGEKFSLPEGYPQH